MIPDSREIIRALQGAWLLARFKPEGMAWFNITADGFWRSFFAAALLAPFAVITSAIFYSEATVGLVRYVGVDVIHYVLAWSVFPVAMIFVARALKLTEQYVGFIIAYNWFTVIVQAVFFPLNLAISNAAASWSVIFVLLSAEVYFFLVLIFIARTALSIRQGLAVIVTFLNLGLSATLSLAIYSLL
jgi:hypothetical protein